MKDDCPATGEVMFSCTYNVMAGLLIVCEFSDWPNENTVKSIVNVAGAILRRSV